VLKRATWLLLKRLFFLRVWVSSDFLEWSGAEGAEKRGENVARPWHGFASRWANHRRWHKAWRSGRIPRSIKNPNRSPWGSSDWGRIQKCRSNFRRMAPWKLGCSALAQGCLWFLVRTA